MFQNFQISRSLCCNVTVEHFRVTQRVLTAEDAVAYDAVRDANDVPENFCGQWC